MRKKFDAVATIGTYKDGSGQEKKRYLTVGAVFEDDKGRLSMKLEAVPCSPEWSGWISFYEPRQDGGGGRPPQQQARTAPAPAAAPQPAQLPLDEPEDDIPF